MLRMFPFSHRLKIESYHSDMGGLLTTSPLWYGVGGFLGRPISVFPMACMFLIWLNIRLFSWILVMMISLSIRSVIPCNLLHFPVICWLDMASKTCWTVVSHFLTMLRIQTLVLFLAGNAWLNGLLFSDLHIYGMLWCSKDCVTIPMGVLLGGKLTLTLNISSFIKGLSDSLIFNVVRVDIFFPIISSETGDHPFPNLLLCSSNFSDEKYLSFLVWGSQHFCCLCNPWMILFVFCKSNCLGDDVKGCISHPNVLSSCMLGFLPYHKKWSEVLSNIM